MLLISTLTNPLSPTPLPTPLTSIAATGLDVVRDDPVERIAQHSHKAPLALLGRQTAAAAAGVALHQPSYGVAGKDAVLARAPASGGAALPFMESARRSVVYIQAGPRLAVDYVRAVLQLAVLYVQAVLATVVELRRSDCHGSEHKRGYLCNLVS